MEKEIIRQELIDSFDRLKDSWDLNRHAITLCIAEMLKYDGGLSMDMWLYVLKKNEDLLSKRIEAINLIPLVIEKMTEVREHYEYLARMDDVYLNEIIPDMLDKPEILEIIFGKAYCAGTTWHNIIPSCLAYILLVSNTDSVKQILNHLYNNKRLKGNSQNKRLRESISDFFSVTSNVLENLFADDDIPFKSLKQEIKESIVSSLDNIKDPLLKAEYTISLLPITQL